MNSTQISKFFAARRDKDEAMVLAMVVETSGSTYSKAGDYMIIAADGRFQGMLSGGCLEGDLAERATNVIDSQCPTTVEYDLSADDELFGLGVGCEGAMHVLLLPLIPENNYEPFASIDTLSRPHSPARVELRLPTASVRVLDEADEPEGLVFDLLPPPRLLVLGAGMDAEPLIRFAGELGWHCTVQDHRPAYVEARALSADITMHCVPPEQIATVVTLNEIDLAMVMSHHLVSDAAYLRQLADSDIGYIGLLGPPHRRARLLESLGPVADALRDRLHGPAGLQLGGRGPGPIALSIVAEMQRYLAEQQAHSKTL